MPTLRLCEQLGYNTCGTQFMPSSVVANMTYTAENQTLRIVYVSGLVYDYSKVPESVYLEMKAAFSKGTFLNERIKGHYPYKKVN